MSLQPGMGFGQWLGTGSSSGCRQPLPSATPVSFGLGKVEL